jgi:hypothetical protein
MSAFLLLRGRWRLFWNLCPACNSDAPEVDTCRVCQGFDRLKWPPSADTKSDWWQRFITPPAPLDGNCAQIPIKQHWLKRSWRFILQAYWQPTECKEPEDVLLIPSRIVTVSGKPINSTPIYAKDAVFIQVGVSLSILDKLRLLLGCKLQVNSVVYCAVPPGALKTETTAFATFD